MITRRHVTATPLYPGSFFAETGRPVTLPDSSPSTASAYVEDDGVWFGIEVRSVVQKRWTDGDGGEMWTPEGETSSYRIYVGELFTAEQIEALPDADLHDILLSNMRGNGWKHVVKTRRGNFQPVEDKDVVVPDTYENTEG